MYLEALRLRTEPEKFGALTEALKGFKEASDGRRRGWRSVRADCGARAVAPYWTK